MSTPRGRPEAIVRPKAGQRAFDVERIAPAASLAEFVEYYWLVRWDVPTPYRQPVVPQPRVHVAAEEGRLLVYGVTREPFFRVLTGAGHVLGAAFRPGGFRPLLKGSVGAISGTVRTGREVFARDDRPAAARILTETEEADSNEMVDALEAYLLSTEPEPDPTGREVTAMVDAAGGRSDIVRAEQLAAHAGVSLRTLQRLFTEYVGMGPKWVIQRFRILDAAEAAHSGEPVDWSARAYELGFSDQAHLTRAFAQVVGTPPAAYKRDPGTS